jgi:hypothetical protein
MSFSLLNSRIWARAWRIQHFRKDLFQPEFGFFQYYRRGQSVWAVRSVPLLGKLKYSPRVTPIVTRFAYLVRDMRGDPSHGRQLFGLTCLLPVGYLCISFLLAERCCSLMD